MDAVGYIRVSTKAQDGEDRYGVEVQRRAIEKYAKENGYIIKRWYKDEISGIKDDRKDFNKILYGDIKEDAVIVFKSDRIARDTKLYFYYLYCLERRGLKLISTIEEFDESSDLANVYRAILQFVAEQERKNIALRTSAGKQIKRSQGGFMGGITPYGYFSLAGEMEIEPKEAKVVRMIFELHDSGMSYLQMASYLDEKGIRTRSHKKWQTSTLFGIIKNRPVYEGKVPYEGRFIEGKHKPILKGVR